MDPDEISTVPLGDPVAAPAEPPVACAMPEAPVAFEDLSVAVTTITVVEEEEDDDDDDKETASGNKEEE